MLFLRSGCDLTILCTPPVVFCNLTARPMVLQTTPAQWGVCFALIKRASKNRSIFREIDSLHPVHFFLFRVPREDECCLRTNQDSALLYYSPAETLTGDIYNSQWTVLRFARCIAHEFSLGKLGFNMYLLRHVSRVFHSSSASLFNHSSKHHLKLNSVASVQKILFHSYPQVLLAQRVSRYLSLLINVT